MQFTKYRKDSDAGRDWGQKEKGTTEDEMAGWHHWLDGLESQWTPGVGDGQGGLHAAIRGVAKSWTLLGDWTKLNTCYLNEMPLIAINLLFRPSSSNELGESLGEENSP